MSVSSTKYLGQLLPAVETNGFTEQINQEIRSGKYEKIQVWVASDNALKVGAAKKAVVTWAEKYSPQASVEAKGYAVSSDISEQPHSKEETERGAKNRLSHLKDTIKNQTISLDALQVFVSMENGIMQEEVRELENPDIFTDSDGKCWIDRCYVVVEVASRMLVHEGIALSVGVTTPLSAVEKSKKTNWEKTCGSFIEQEYGFSAKDWHGKMAGKGREAIMQETINAAFGLQPDVKEVNL